MCTLGAAVYPRASSAFSIYLFQVFAVPAVALVLRGLGAERVLPIDIPIVLTWVSSYGAGLCVWALVERPVARRLRPLTTMLTASRQRVVNA
jgi:peptidoglycan/LPS O-acetylase OafA/YrhL